ncbi:phosphatidylinositol-glycan-specific phospholipase D-like [Battus philenor]|uniref:phosphatidylinositol-glycan-specific phospholipase D-like n=1 Tax=Battus philenor TaxID=42288 RepID=UPI0035CF90DC
MAFGYSMGFLKAGQLNSFTGGVGWTMLVDESNDLILISKIFEGGQVNYISISDPLEPANSTEDSQKFTKHVKQFRNVGSSLASGTFSIYGVNQTIYAFTMQYKSMTNRIEFLRYSKKKILTLIKNVGIESETINAMFGWAMLGVDLNGDGYTELVVGAPAQCDDDEYYETGALHIYTGGDLETIGKVNRMRSILGTKIGSRFGNAIASADIDGDNIPGY